jgi:catechol 2,3-dioxygenase-like lactoylglutathione lyase family enzyme
MKSKPQIRIAHPTSDLARITAMYREGLGLEVIATFVDHAGFDGVILGTVGSGYHIEFTHCRKSPVLPSPSVEDLLVFYLPNQKEWQQLCETVLSVGFKQVSSFNPYWDNLGRTFEDFDGYRIVLQNAAYAPERK